MLIVQFRVENMNDREGITEIIKSHFLNDLIEDRVDVQERNRS